VRSEPGLQLQLRGEPGQRRCGSVSGWAQRLSGEPGGIVLEIHDLDPGEAAEVPVPGHEPAHPVLPAHCSNLRVEGRVARGSGQPQRLREQAGKRRSGPRTLKLEVVVRAFNAARASSSDEGGSDAEPPGGSPRGGAGSRWERRGAHSMAEWDRKVCCTLDQSGRRASTTRTSRYLVSPPCRPPVLLPVGDQLEAGNPTEGRGIGRDQGKPVPEAHRGDPEVAGADQRGRPKKGPTPSGRSL